MSTAYTQGLQLASAGYHADAIAQFEQALSENPRDTRALFALGNTAVQLGMHDAATRFFRQVLQIEPMRLEALIHLANLLRAQSQYDDAIALLEPALARGPAPELHLTLGNTWREKGDQTKAIRHYRAALTQKPKDTSALTNLADMLCDAGDRAQALDLYDAAIKNDPSAAQARLNRAIAHLLNGNLKDGWRDYAARLEIPGQTPEMLGHPHLMAWTGGNLKNKRLLVRAEQGVGDQLLFAALIPDLAARATDQGGRVVLECEPRLVSLLARSFPAVTVRPAQIRQIGARMIADYGWLTAAGGADTVTMMGDLPRHLRGSLTDFPARHAFLRPDPQEVAHWNATLGENAIGICWRSAKSGGHRAVQYAPLTAWADFLRNVTRPIISVQYDATPEEIAQLEHASGRKILVPQGIDQKHELDRAAGLMAALSLVVSAPTAVSWLAAGVGTPTCKVLYDTSWTALGQTYEPFAPACQCIMPAVRGDWTDVFAQIKSRL